MSTNIKMQVKNKAIGKYKTRQMNSLYFLRISSFFYIHFNWVIGHKGINRRFNIGGAQQTAPYFSSYSKVGNYPTKTS